MRKILRVCFLFFCFPFITVSASDRKEAFDAKHSFDFSAMPKFFLKENLGQNADFSRPGIPEFTLRSGVYKFSFNLEPSISLRYLTNSGDASTGDIRYQLFGFSLGARQYGWDPSFFWLVPFAELNFIYSVMLYDADGAPDAKGGELGIDVGGGVQISLAAIRSALRHELEGVWNLKDFGLQIRVSYYPGGVFRSGSFDRLSSISSWSAGGGFYVAW